MRLFFPKSGVLIMPSHTSDILTLRQIFRSQAYKQKGSLEVTFSPTICISANFAKFNFFEKLNYGTPHMIIYGAQVDQKWTERGPEVECEGSTSIGHLHHAIFLFTKGTWTPNFGASIMNKYPFIDCTDRWGRMDQIWK